MADFLPPGFVFPPPPPWWALSPPPPPPPPPPWRSTSYTDDSPSTGAGLIAAVSLPIALIFLVVLIGICGAIARRQPAASSVPAAAEPRDNDDDDEQQLRRRAVLPSFTYTLSLKHNVTGTGDEEAATCSVCLGALEVGETVRLLPACLHLYHVECIDPWLNAHSTCPICRSGTMDEGPRLPPV